MTVKRTALILPGPDSGALFAEMECFLARIGGGEHAELAAANDERAQIPAALLEVIRQAVAAMKDGNAVGVVAANYELTTQQAADLLNISRPFLIKLLERGDLKFQLTGTHRRIELQELLRYKEERSARRLAALSEMARDAESSRSAKN
jgi:excisionase family DNA binding protein